MHKKSLDVLRKIKSEALQEQDNNPDDIIDIFMEIKKQQEEKDQYIQKLSIHPFYVITYSKAQIELLKNMNSAAGDVTLYLDATGGLVRPPIKNATIYYTCSVQATVWTL